MSHRAQDPQPRPEPPTEVVLARRTPHTALAAALLLLFHPDVSRHTPVRIAGAHGRFGPHQLLLGLPAGRGGSGEHLGWFGSRSPFTTVLDKYAPAAERGVLAPLDEHLTRTWDAEAPVTPPFSDVHGGSVETLVAGLILLHDEPDGFASVVRTAADLLEGQLKRAADMRPRGPVTVQIGGRSFPAVAGFRATVAAGDFGLALRRADGEQLRMDHDRIRRVLVAHGEPLERWEATAGGAGYARRGPVAGDDWRRLIAKLARVLARLLEGPAPADH